MLATVVLAAVASAGCGKGAPAPKTAQSALVPAPPAAPPPPAPITLLPADVARAALVATMVAPTLNRALASGVALARQAAPLPLDPAAVREMALGQVGIPPEIGRQLDLDAPVSGAVVGFGREDAVRAAFTFTLKAGTDVSKFLGMLGTVIARAGTVWRIQTPHNGEGWFMPTGNVIVFADSELALAQAANLALEARRPVKDDAAVVLYPEGLARASGTDVKTALDRLLAMIEDRAVASGTKLGAEGRAQLREVVGYAAEV